MMMKNVFCICVPLNASRKATPSTMPGMVLVTRATLSSIFPKGVTESASRRNQSRSVNDQGAQGCCKNGRQQRVLVDSDQALVTEGRLDMI